jgi:pimeloyl-ACP methyl ester carboxylesterase
LRSYGGSGKDFTTNSLEDHALDVTRVLKHFHMSHASVIGFGFGGHVALKLAEIAPYKIGNIVLVNSGNPDLSQDAKTFYKQEIEKLCKSYSNIDEYNQHFSSNSIDLKHKLAYDHKAFDEFKISRISKAVASQNLETLEKESTKEDKFWKIRHPITIVKSQFGLKEKDPNSLLTDENVEKMKKILNVKKVLTVRRSTHQNILYEQEFSSQIMKEMEELMSETDKHRKIEKFLESLRTGPEAELIEENYFKGEGYLAYLRK